MIFAKLDVCMPTHPKFVAAGPAAVGYWAAALAYVRGHDLDGKLPDSALGILLGVGAGEGRQLAERLVSVGLFQRIRGGYFIFNYASKNETKAQVEARRAATRERVARSRGKASANGSAHGGNDNVTRDVTRVSNNEVTTSGRASVPDSDSDSVICDLPEERSGSCLRVAAATPPSSPSLEAERYVQLDDAMTPEQREIAAFPGCEVAEVESVWRKFTGYYAGQWLHVSGKWQKWCTDEAKKQRAERERERKRDDAKAQEFAAASEERASEIRKSERARDRADAVYSREAVPAKFVAGDLLKAIGGKS